MSEIKIEWDDDNQTTIYALYPVNWTWDDYHAVVDQLSELISDGRQINFINEYAPGSHYPTGAPSVHQRRSMRTFNVGRVAYVTEDAFLRAAISAFVRMQPALKRGQNFDIFETVADARKFIYEN